MNKNVYIYINVYVSIYISYIHIYIFICTPNRFLLKLLHRSGKIVKSFRSRSNSPVPSFRNIDTSIHGGDNRNGNGYTQIYFCIIYKHTRIEMYIYSCINILE